MAEHPDKDALISELAEARTRMTGNFRALRYDLEIVPRLKANIARNSLAWFAGAALAGLLLAALIPPRKRVVIQSRRAHDNTTEKAGKAAFALTLLKFAFDFAKPVLLRALAERFRPRPVSSR